MLCSRGEKDCFGFGGQKRKRRALASSTTQARPSLRFSPVIALHRKICHRCVRISSSCNACKLLLAPDAAVAVCGVQTSEISSPVMHPLTSVLFANTSRLAPESRFSPFCQLQPSVEERKHQAHLFLEKTMQLLSAVLDTQAVCGINNPYQGVCFLKIVAPVGSQCLLPSHVP